MAVVMVMALGGHHDNGCVVMGQPGWLGVWVVEWLGG